MAKNLLSMIKAMKLPPDVEVPLFCGHVIRVPEGSDTAKMVRHYSEIVCPDCWKQGVRR